MPPFPLRRSLAPRLLGALSLVTVSALTASLLVMLSRTPLAPAASPLMGLYEWRPSGAQERSWSLAVLFLDWNDPAATSQLHAFLQASQGQQRLPLVTLEPFPDHRAGRNNGDLLQDVLQGRHDPAIDAIGATLARHGGPVLLRFAHEMDRPAHYPWAFAEPDDYLRFYRHVHDRISAFQSRNLRWVWSPIGTSRADLYWPGEPYADLIGLSIYASRAWTPDGTLEPFAAILQRHHWLQQRYRLPVLIAEAGVSGSAEDQRRWLADAIRILPSQREVCGLVYFHAPQPRWMPLPTGHEDWSLKGPALHWFLGQLPLTERVGRSCLGD